MLLPLYVSVQKFILMCALPASDKYCVTRTETPVKTAQKQIKLPPWWINAILHSCESMIGTGGLH